MEKVILDTSVILKWYVQETQSEKANLLLEKYKQGSLSIFIPDIVSLELANALYFGARYKGKILEEILTSFYKLDLFVIPLSESVIWGTSKVMEKLSIAIYDALFIYLAEQKQIPLITADKKHHQKKFSKMIKYL